MLHVLNGDSTYVGLRPLRLAGRALVWRDALLEGPVPNGLRSDEDWAERARELARDAGMDERAFRDGALAFFRDLGSAREREEVVLWFEEDLFCQLPLAYLLARKPLGAPWSVVCHEQRLGTAPPDQLAVFFDTRRPASDALVALAERAWSVYASSDTQVSTRELLSKADFAPWPLLARGLELHLARFPGDDGLGLIERSALVEAAYGGTFSAVFARWSARPDVRDYGLGDMQLAGALWSLAQARLAHLAGAASDMRAGTLEGAPRWRVEATPLGRAVLAGEARAQLPARWIGGARAP